MSKLDGDGTKSTGPAPDQDHFAFLELVAPPAKERAVGGCADQRAGCCRLPGEVRGFRQTLVRLRNSKLAERAIVRLVSPDFRGGRDHRVFPCPYPGVVFIPPSMMDDHLITNFDVGHLTTDSVDNAGSVTPTNVKIARVARCLPGYDHIDWYPSRSPHIVIVDTRRHDSDQHLVRGNVWYLHLLDLEGNTRLAQPVLAYDLRI